MTLDLLAGKHSARTLAQILRRQSASIRDLKRRGFTGEQSVVEDQDVVTTFGNEFSAANQMLTSSSGSATPATLAMPEQSAIARDTGGIESKVASAGQYFRRGVSTGLLGFYNFLSLFSTQGAPIGNEITVTEGVGGSTATFTVDPLTTTVVPENPLGTPNWTALIEIPATAEDGKFYIITDLLGILDGTAPRRYRVTATSGPGSGTINGNTFFPSGGAYISGTYSIALLIHYGLGRWVGVQL